MTLSDMLLGLGDVPPEKQFWWCNVHQRQATHFEYFNDDGGRVASFRVTCDPKFGGIMIPCQCVNLTGIAEITEDAD